MSESISRLPTIAAGSGAIGLTDVIPVTQGFSGPGTGTTRITSVAQLMAGTAKFNVKRFGAIGDGASHLASGYYATLAALQTVYSFATSLNNEMDWLGTQAAINAAAASGTGGVVYSPAGNYLMSNSHSVSDVSGTITLPAASTIGGASSVEVSWVGDGQGTVYSWPNDLGSGKYGVLCNANRSNPNYSAYSPGYVQDITLIGPAASTTMGTAAANMTGFGTADRRNLAGVNISNFWAGIGLVGGHARWAKVLAQGCYYGVYAEAPANQTNGSTTGELSGGIHLDTCDFTNNVKSAFGVHHAGALTAAHMTNCFLGKSPYSFFKETNSGSPTNTYAIQGVTCDGCRFNDLGNGIIDDDQGGNSVVLGIAQWTLRDCEFKWDSWDSLNFHLPSTSTGFAIFTIGACAGLVLDGMVNPSQWQPGTDSWIHVAQCSGLSIRGDLDSVLSACSAASSPRSKSFADGSYPPASTRLQADSGWSGHVRYVQATASVGSILIELGDTDSNTQLCAGVSSEASAGVAMFVSNLSGAGYVVTAKNGNVPVNYTGTITVGQRLRTSSGGTVQTGGSGAQVGFAMKQNGSQWNCLLNIT